MQRSSRIAELGPTVFDCLVQKLGPAAELGSRSRDSFADRLTRDLHLLLNTRREEDLVPREFEECASSVLNFGVTDLTRSGSLESTVEQSRLCRSLEEAIRTFEPRLRSISIRLIDSGERSPLVRFRLEARAELDAERVTFEVGLKRDTGEMSVLPR